MSEEAVHPGTYKDRQDGKLISLKLSKSDRSEDKPAINSLHYDDELEVSDGLKSLVSANLSL